MSENAAATQKNLDDAVAYIIERVKEMKTEIKELTDAHNNLLIDTKTELGKVSVEMRHLRQSVDKLEDAISGNGTEGLKAQVASLVGWRKSAYAQLEKFEKICKEIVTKKPKSGNNGAVTITSIQEAGLSNRQRMTVWGSLGTAAVTGIFAIVTLLYTFPKSVPINYDKLAISMIKIQKKYQNKSVKQ